MPNSKNLLNDGNSLSDAASFGLDTHGSSLVTNERT